MNAGRYRFKMERARVRHKCGECKRIIKVKDIRVRIGSGGDVFDSLICRICCGKLAEFFDKASYIR